MVRRGRSRLREAGLPAGDVAIGLMLEVPAAAVSIDMLLEEVDFVSIGSNDLVQYLMAADRDNPRVNHLCQPLAPPVLRVLDQVIRTCNDARKPVTLCGEMAGRPRCFLPLFGMGLRRMSMSPAFVPTIKELVRCTPRDVAEEIAAHVVRLRTFKQVRDYLSRKAKQVCPNVTFFDTTR